jgi:hypothetical protein
MLLLFKSPDSFGHHNRKSKMNPTRRLLIHELLPSEIMGVIFEEHAELEWKAPAIDGRVCRIWRQIVLNTPRAWIYLVISTEDPPGTTELREWVNRSGSAPLHIRIHETMFNLDYHKYAQSLHGLLRSYHTRIASLRLPLGHPSFFDMRDFPCLRLLDIDQWDSTGPTSRPVWWDSMFALRSLRVVAARVVLTLPWSELPQLEALTLCYTRLTSIPQHCQSLTTLMLENVSIEDAISSPITFPSLTYLSLWAVPGLKPYINAPCLVSHHEVPGEESSSSPLPSLVEYGVYCPSFNHANPATWHRSFPNMLRLTIRADPPVLLSFFLALSRDPHSLPALQMINARPLYGSFTEEQQELMRDLVLARSGACQMDVMLYFDTKQPFHNPIFFGEVRCCLSNDLLASNAHSRNRNLLSESRQARA